MGRTLIKICGVTRVEDALAAARLGADFVGMVLHTDSPRTITLDRARKIVDALPNSATPVGVFVDAPPDEVVRTHGRMTRAELGFVRALTRRCALETDGERNRQRGGNCRLRSQRRA